MSSPAIAALTKERARLSEWTLAETTREAYAEDWRQFTRWCAEMGYEPLPAAAEVVTLYLTYVLRSRKLTSARRYASAINYYHQDAGHPKPGHLEVQQILDGADRQRRESPRQKRPLTVEQLRQVALSLPDDARGTRDRALLVLGFSLALRRSNLIALDMSDLTFVSQGLLIRLNREKQDQHGRGRTVAVPRGEHPETCPVRAVEAWLAIRGSDPGPLLCRLKCHNRAITPTRIRLGIDTPNLVVKRAVRLLGLPAGDYGSHSLRASFVTAAFEAGCDSVVIAETTGHKSLASLRRYFRRTDPFRANPSGMIGL